MAMPPRNNRKGEPQPPPPSSSSAANSFSRAPPTTPTTFPPGYKFVPSEEDLIVHYLKPFLRSNKNPPPNVPIHRVNIYESNPQRLSREYKQGNEKEWFFVTERTEMHEGGKKKQNRCDNGGFWKARSALEEFKTRAGVAFSRMVLEHYIGNNQNGVRSEWVMYEYLTESSPGDKSNGDNKGDYALCKIYMTPRGVNRKEEEEEESQEVDQPCNPEDYGLCKICMTPRRAKRKAEEEEENEKRRKKKKEGGEASQEVDQPCNPEVQQTHLLPQQPCPFSFDEFRELFNFTDDVFTGSIDLNPTG